MGASLASIRPTPPALLVAAVFSSQTNAIDWALERIALQWGKISLLSPRFEHVETNYYAREMGLPISKQLVVVQGLFDPAGLADRKLQSNTWEQELASSKIYDLARPINIDPGYLMLGKLVLASTKDRAHRIYLRDGIYAEECLYYVAGWQVRPWTYPDYQRDDYHQFLSQARQLLKQTIADADQRD